MITARSEARAIVEKLGCMPLAIDHAGAFIHELRIPLSSYVSHYETAFKEVQSKKPRLGWKYQEIKQLRQHGRFHFQL